MHKSEFIVSLTALVLIHRQRLMEGLVGLGGRPEPGGSVMGACDSRSLRRLRYTLEAMYSVPF